jgi:hypothetical protein
MPISHITLRGGYSADYLEAISLGLHQALVTTFDVPEDDCFQIFHQMERGAMRGHPHYLTSGRGEDWLLIEITAGKPRNAQIKRAFYRDLATRLAANPGLPSGELMVVIRHNAAEDWSFGDGLASMLSIEEEI